MFIGAEVVGNRFITEWLTTTNGETISLPLQNATTNFKVWWGDGSSDTITAYNQAEVTHTFATAGTQTIELDGVFSLNTTYGAIVGDRPKLKDITQWGIFPITPPYQFNRTDFTNISATDAPDLSAVTSLQGMFYQNTGLTYSGIGNWDVSNISNMAEIFTNCYSWNEDLTGLVTSNVTTVAGICNFTLFDGTGLDTWDVSNVNSFQYSFDGCATMNPDITGWTMSSTNNTDYMFRGCQVFNQNLNSWNVSNVTSAIGMFHTCYVFNSPLDSWNVTNLNRADYMFVNCFAFNQDLNSWDVSGFEIMQYMFTNATSFNGNITSWQPSICTYFRYMFQGCTSFNQDIGGWDVSSGQYFNNMFDGATSFDQNLGTWSVTNMLDATAMFNGVTLSIANYDALLIGWEAQAVQNNVVFSGGNSQYSSAAAAARQRLITDHSWTITDGGEWQPVTASGGVTYSYNDGSNDYMVHYFNSNGNFVVSDAGTDAEIEYMIVAGGGAGGGGYTTRGMGGGGAGGVLHTFGVGHSITATTYPLVVGGGGLFTTPISANAEGYNSSGFSVTAIGGGRGANRVADASSGGSGGGACVDTTGGAGTVGQGNDGGDRTSTFIGGGGGGYSAAGGDGDGTNAGDGGSGFDASTYIGTTIGDSGVFAGGGGGGIYISSVYGGDGGAGGGGEGGNLTYNTNGTNGTANTGGGGGGASTGGDGGTGGSGIVVIRYKLSL